MAELHELLRDELPRLAEENYRITSPSSWEYNCIAWAMDITDTWWWPTAGRYWPDDVPLEETIEAFLSAFALFGFHRVANADHEQRVEKIAIYAQSGVPSHAARQLTNGWWTSKLGPSMDIEHQTPDAVAGGLYGEVVALLGRNRET